MFLSAYRVTQKSLVTLTGGVCSVPVMGKSKSRFDLNRDLKTFGDLI